MMRRVVPRVAWHALPADLREGIETVLGGTVVEARSQTDGFSPGSADRLRTHNARHAFVKTASKQSHAGSSALHVRELAIMRVLPESVPAPRLLGVYENATSIALIFDDIEGRHPGTECDGADVKNVLGALKMLPRVRGTSVAGLLLDASYEFAADASSWQEIVDEGDLSTLPSWAQTHLERLTDAAQHASAAAAGDHLLHFDCRADNLLLDPVGKIWLVDWPWAAIGAPWLDGLSYLLDARLRGELFDPENVIDTHPLFADVPAESIDAVLAATTGMFFNKARQPSPSGMPTLRAFQRSEAIAGMEWLRERWQV